jgi:hypothetical protein
VKLLIIYFFLRRASLPLTQVGIFSLAPCSQIPSVYVIPFESGILFHAHINKHIKLQSSQAETIIPASLCLVLCYVLECFGVPGRVIHIHATSVRQLVLALWELIQVLIA